MTTLDILKVARIFFKFIIFYRNSFIINFFSFSSPLMEFEIQSLKGMKNLQKKNRGNLKNLDEHYIVYRRGPV